MTCTIDYYFSPQSPWTYLGHDRFVDMARRAIHNQGADMLKERLEGKIDIDFDTSRRLFTLICVLHIKG